MFKLFYTSIKSLFTILDDKLKKRFFGILILILITGLLDTLGLASIIPAISILFDPTYIDNSDILKSFKVFFGIEENATFGVFVFGITLVVFIFRSAFVLVSNFFQQKFGYNVVLYLVENSFHYLFNNKKFYLIENDTEKGVRELMISPQHLNGFLLKPLLLIGSEFFVFTFLIVGIIFIDIKVFLIITCTIVPFSGFFYLIIKKRITKWSNIRVALSGRTFALAFQYISGFIDIIIKNKQNHFQNKFMAEFERLFSVDFKNGFVQIIPAKIFEITAILGLMIIVIYSTFFNSSPKDMLPLALIYMAAAYRIIPSLSKITSAVISLQQSLPLVKVYQELFSMELENPDNEIGSNNLVFEKSISFQEIDFGFADKKIFQDFSSVITKGKATAIVGPSGSGKTTLINILLGFREPIKGKVLLDNIPLKRTDYSALRAKVGYVQQNVFILNATIKENVAIGDDFIDEQRVLKALKQASLEEFYLSKENGIDFQIREFGKNLSGGQKQRLSIARALYNNAEILILDEATSALDEQTESEIIETLQKLKLQGITIIIIAHQSKILTICDTVLNLSHQA